MSSGLKITSDDGSGKVKLRSVTLGAVVVSSYFSDDGTVHVPF